MRHTKGPWVERDAEVEGADGSKIGQLYARPEDDGTWGPGVADANTRLVCAAPDLLVALEALTEAASNQLPQGADHDGLTNCDLLTQARKAIKLTK
jgi:hypothetical protein